MIRWALFLLSLFFCGLLAIVGVRTFAGPERIEQAIVASLVGLFWAALTADFWFWFLGIGGQR